MLDENITVKIKRAVRNSGYPLEQRVGTLLEQKGWHSFYSVNYRDPMTDKDRELDILAYKEIRELRIELRISCKRSLAKPWVLFTEDSTRYCKHGNILKLTPVSSKSERYSRILTLLSGLLFFKHPRQAINFCAFSGNDFSNEARTLVKDGLYSALNSVNLQLFPHFLMFDPRGTIYFFLNVLEGRLFESFYDVKADDDQVVEVQYGQWETRFTLKNDVETISDAQGRKVSLSDVLYWFSDWFRVEIVTWPLFTVYLDQLEATFSHLKTKELSLFGLPWKLKNYPKIVGPSPRF